MKYQLIGIKTNDKHFCFSCNSNDDQYEITYDKNVKSIHLPNYCDNQYFGNQNDLICACYSWESMLSY